MLKDVGSADPSTRHVDCAVLLPPNRYRPRGDAVSFYSCTIVFSMTYRNRFSITAVDTAWCLTFIHSFIGREMMYFRTLRLAQLSSRSCNTATKQFFLLNLTLFFVSVSALGGTSVCACVCVCVYLGG